MKSDTFGPYHHQEQPAEQQTEGELRHLHEAMQRNYHLRENLGGHEPCDNREPEYLPDDGRDAKPVQSVALASSVEMLTDGEPDDEEGNQLSDYHGREDLDADGIPETSFVDQHLGNDSEAGER